MKALLAKIHSADNQHLVDFLDAVASFSVLENPTK